MNKQARDLIEARLKEYRANNGRIHWDSDNEMLYVLQSLNYSDDTGKNELPFSFDTVSSITQNGGQDTVLATYHCYPLNHSVVLEWEFPTHFDNKREFMINIEALYEQINIINRKLRPLTTNH